MKVIHNQKEIAKIMVGSKIHSGCSNITTSGDFSGTFLLPDGKIAEKYVEFGWSKIFVWDNKNAWENENKKSLSIAREREW